MPLASNYDSAADAAVKKVAEAADKHRADATQIIAAAHAPQRGTNAGGRRRRRRRRRCRRGPVGARRPCPRSPAAAAARPR
ncbi:hypothetical protein ACFQV8_02920 [Pseudonocardia benzenivorans]